MAKLSDCLKIHFGDEQDKYIVNMVKQKARSISGGKRVSPKIATAAVNQVIADFEADSAAIKKQLEAYGGKTAGVSSAKAEGSDITGHAQFNRVDPADFVEEREKTKRPEFLTPYKPEDMKGWKTYLTGDGVGYSLTDQDDIIGIFNNSGRRGAGVEAVIEAIKNGGKTLDCIDGHLDKYYSKFGFNLKERIEWNDDYAPEGWNYEKYGRPTVSFWEYPDGLSRDPSDVRRRFETSRSQGNALSEHSGAEGLRSGEHRRDSSTPQPGMDQGAPGAPDRGVGADRGDVEPAGKNKLSYSIDNPRLKSENAAMTSKEGRADIATGTKPKEPSGGNNFIDASKQNPNPSRSPGDGEQYSVSTRKVPPGKYPETLGVVDRHTTVSKLKSHPDYEAAKYGGDAEVAERVVHDLVRPETLDEIKNKLDPNKPVYVVPVIQREGESANMLPIAYAERLAKEIGGEVWYGTGKISGEALTNADAKKRTTNEQLFDGDLPPGGSQVIVVDDTFTSGNTLTSLIDKLSENGSIPVAATSLASGRYQNWLIPSKEKRQALLDKAGVTEIQFKHEFGYPTSQLTGSEIQQYLLTGGKGIAGLRSRFPVGGSQGGREENTSRNGSTGSEHQKQDPVTPLSENSWITLKDVQDMFPGHTVTDAGNGAFKITSGTGASITVETVNHIGIDDAAFEISYQRKPTAGEKAQGASGSYQNGTIKISKTGDRWTLSHEAYHHLEASGMISAGDVLVLNEALRKQGVQKPTEEARAKYVEDMRFKRDTAAGKLRQLLHKIGDLVDGFVNLFHRTALGVMRDIESGRVYNRPENTKGNHQEQYDTVGAAEKFQKLPVVNIENNMVSLEEAENIYSKLETAQNKADHRTIKFVKSVWGKLARHRQKELIFKSASKFKELFESAMPAYSEEERSNQKHPNVKGYHNYVAKATIGGEGYYFRFTVREVNVHPGKTYNPNELHNLFVSDIEITKAAIAHNLTGLSLPGIDANRGLLDMKLIEWLRKVNPVYSIKQLTGDQSPGSSSNDPFAAENRRLREQDKTLWEKAGKLLREQFAPGGLLPKEVFDSKIERDSEFEVTELYVSRMVRALEKAVKKDFGAEFGKLPLAGQKKLADALAGRVPADLPEDTKTAIVAMRRYIDGLSNEYAQIVFDQAKALEESGNDEAAAAKVDLLNTIAGNMGEYVHRSYRAFDDKKWFSKVPTEIINDARIYLRDRYMENGQTDQKEADRLASIVVNKILKTGTAYDSMESFIKESKLGAKDLSLLKRRKDIAPEIRALLGQHIDPRVNFAKTATKMGRLVWNQRFLDKVREIGMGSFLFEGMDRPDGATAQIAADQSETYSPLNGLWTFPEIDKAFRDALGKEQMANWWRTIVQVNGLVKFGKTVLSPTTAMRNWQSAMFFALANGHFNMTHMAKSLGSFKTYFTDGGKQARFDYLVKLKRLGVAYDTPYAGEMMRLLADSRMTDDLIRGTGHRSLKNMLGYAQKFYQYGDDFWKIIGFENEKTMLMDTGMDEAAAEKEAAERIRNTYPTYSMVGKAITALRRFPLVGTFVSFPAEIIRTQVNMLRYAARDFKAPGRKKMALRRMAGMAISAGMFYGLQALSRYLLGVDDEEDEATRMLAAPWSKNAKLWYVSREKDGALRYFDMSFLDPYGLWKRPLTAIMRDQPWEQKFADAAWNETLEVFFGTDILAGALFEVAANKRNDTGTQVYKETDSPAGQLSDIGAHLAKKLQPGIMTNITRTLKAIEGARSPSGKLYTLEDEMMALIGWRPTTTDPKIALYYRTFEFNDAKKEAMSGLYKKVRDVNPVEKEDIRKAFEDAGKLRKKAYTEMARVVHAARKSGMSKGEITKVLQASGVSKADVFSLTTGNQAAWRLTSQIVKDDVRKSEILFKTGGQTLKRYQQLLEISGGAN